MWNFLFNEIFYRPQLNIVQLLFNYTKDIGYAMIIIAILFNIIAFRWFTKSFLNMQKRLALGQDFKNIQEYFKEKNRLIQSKIAELSKDATKNETEINTLNLKLRTTLFDQQKLTGEVNKRFNIVGNYSFKTILVQLWISLGLFSIFRDITDKGGVLKGLYPGLWNGVETSNFGSTVKAFGNIEIAKGLWETNLMWVPIVNALFTFFALYYSFYFTTRPKVREMTAFEASQADKIKLQNEKDGVPSIDPVKLTESNQKLTIFLTPLMTLFFNFYLPSGLNIYYCFLSILYFVRTWLGDLYYKNHQYKYMVDVLECGPVFPYEDHINELSNGNFDLAGTPSEIISYKKQ
jgi:membrane protein insertase Oxa1/YidC/SpoIIIJ